MLSIDVIFCIPLGFCIILKGVYELWTIPSDNFVYRGTKKIVTSMQDVENENSKLCGSFKSMFGNIGTTYHLWRHENFDEGQALRTLWISNENSNSFLMPKISI